MTHLRRTTQGQTRLEHRSDQIRTKGEIDVAWCSVHGQAVARFKIPLAVRPLLNRPDYCRVRPLEIVHYHFVDSKFPPSSSPAGLPEYLWRQLQAFLSTELIVHKSVAQHGTIQYIPMHGSGGSMVFE